MILLTSSFQYWPSPGTAKKQYFGLTWSLTETTRRPKSTGKYIGTSCSNGGVMVWFASHMLTRLTVKLRINKIAQMILQGPSINNLHATLLMGLKIPLPRICVYMYACFFNRNGTQGQLYDSQIIVLLKCTKNYL